MKRSAYSAEISPPSDSVVTHAYIAVRLADKYAHRLPTPEELQNDLQCSRPTAYRWAKAFRDARGVP